MCWRMDYIPSFAGVEGIGALHDIVLPITVIRNANASSMQVDSYCRSQYALARSLDAGIEDQL